MHKLDGKSWKDELITADPENEDIRKKEVKAGIIQVIDQGIHQEEKILEYVDWPEETVKQALQELKREGALKTVKKVSSASTGEEA